MKKNVDVSIILVNYKTSKLVNACINSIVEKSYDISYEIVIVDNSESEIEFSALVNAVNCRALCINSGKNLGFGNANNLGAKHATGKYLFFLNTDTYLLNNAIYLLFEYLCKNKDVGIVGSNLFTSELHPNHSFLFFDEKYKNDINPKWYKLNLFSRFNKKIIDFNYENEPQNIEGYVCGASLMIEKEVFNQLEGFDKDIFMYAEEALLCYRTINELNLKVMNVPNAMIVHLEGGSFNGAKYGHEKMMVDGNYLFYKKAYGDNTAKRYLIVNYTYYKRRVLLGVFSKKKKELFMCRKQAFMNKIRECSLRL